MEWWPLGIMLLLFGLTVLRGAPYVPTQRRDIEKALDMFDLKKGAVIVDLGSGDGSFLLAAARRGLVAYGYEINPILWLIAWLRCLPYRKNVTVLWRDFWLTPLPKHTKAVFVFAAGPFMKKLVRKLEQETALRQQRFYVVSYGFELPGRKTLKQQNGLHLYRLG